MAYESPIGDQVGDDPLLLDLLGQFPDARTSSLTRLSLPGHDTHHETLALNLPGGHTLEATRWTARPDTVEVFHRPPAQSWEYHPNPIYDDEGWATDADRNLRSSRHTLPADTAAVAGWLHDTLASTE